MRRHIHTGHCSNARAEEFDASGRCLQGMRMWIAAEVFHQNEIAGGRRQFDITRVPEGVEIRKVYVECAMSKFTSAIDLAYPLRFIASFAKHLSPAQAL